VQFITKTRTEHLSTQDKQAIKKNKSSSPIENFLGLAEKHTEKSPMPAVRNDLLTDDLAYIPNRAHGHYKHAVHFSNCSVATSPMLSKCQMMCHD